MKPPSAYDILGIESTATDEEIRKAWRKLTAEHSPDRHMQQPIEVQDEHKAKHLLVQRAYNLLRSPDERAAYDQRRAEREAERSRPVHVAAADILDPAEAARREQAAREAVIQLADAAGITEDKRRAVGDLFVAGAKVADLFGLFRKR